MRNLVIFALVSLLALPTLARAGTHLQGGPYFRGRSVYVDIHNSDLHGVKRGTLYYEAYTTTVPGGRDATWKTRSSIGYSVGATHVNPYVLFSVPQRVAGQWLTIRIHHVDEDGQGRRYPIFQLRVP